MCIVKVFIQPVVVPIAISITLFYSSVMIDRLLIQANTTGLSKINGYVLILLVDLPFLSCNFVGALAGVRMGNLSFNFKYKSKSNL